MKAITIRQPWAQLLVIPNPDQSDRAAKWIETRSRQSHYRGRIAIHAAKTATDLDTWGPDNRMLGDFAIYGPIEAVPHMVCPGGIRTDFEFGKVIGSAAITDCLQVNPPGNEPETVADVDQEPHDRFLCRHIGDSGLTWYEFGDGGRRPATRCDDVTDQMPYGDFTPGRWGLLLADAKPVEERCPVCCGTGSTAVPGGGTQCVVCDGRGACDPIPAKGQQSVPWEWSVE